MSRETRMARFSAEAWGLLACASAVAVLIGGCGGSSSSSSTNSGVSTGQTAKPSSATVPSVTWGLSPPEGPLNQFTNTGPVTNAILDNVTQGLVRYTPAGDLQPSIASSWREVSPTVYTYTLRPGIKFSDGHPVRVADVLYSMRYEMNPKTGLAASSFYADVKSIDPYGSDGVKITLKQPAATWKYVPGHPSTGMIMEQAALQRAGSKLGGPDGIPVSTGPYKITRISTSGVTFVRNPYYWGPAPKVQKVTIDYFSDPTAELAAAQAGQINGAINISPVDLPEWRSVPNMNVVASPDSGAGSVIWFQTSRAPIDNANARQAMLYALNRPAIIKNLLHGDAQPNYSAFPPNLWANEGMTTAQVNAAVQAGKLGPVYQYNIAKAREALARSPYPHGFSVTVDYVGTDEAIDIVQAWAASLAPLGVRVNARQFTSAQFGALFSQSDPAYQILVLSGPGVLDYPDPLDPAGLNVCSDSAAATGCGLAPSGYDIERYANPTVNQLLHEASVNPDVAARRGQIEAMLATVNHDLPMVIPWYEDLLTGLSKQLVQTHYTGPWAPEFTPWMAYTAKAAS